MNERGIIMKRLVCIILILCVLPVCVFAEYAGKTDDELKNDFALILEELRSRGIWASDTIPNGLYIVGKSLPEGAFEFTTTVKGTVEVFPTYEDYSGDHNRLKYEILKEGQTFILTLVDGMCIDLSCDCVIKPLAYSW